MIVIKSILPALLLGNIDTVRCRPETPQQCVNGKCHDAQYGDFTKGIKTTKIDQDDIDDIVTPSFRMSSLQKNRAIESDNGALVIAL